MIFFILFSNNFLYSIRIDKHLINSYTCTMLNTYIISLSTVVHTGMKVHVSTMKYTKLASDDCCIKNSHETHPLKTTCYMYIFTRLIDSL